MKKLVLLALKAYGRTAPYRTPCCRFYPSCSKYMMGCIELHGLGKGLMLGVLRLLRCHPFHPGGIDEVPKSQQDSGFQKFCNRRATARLAELPALPVKGLR